MEKGKIWEGNRHMNEEEIKAPMPAEIIGFAQRIEALTSEMYKRANEEDSQMEFLALVIIAPKDGPSGKISFVSRCRYDLVEDLGAMVATWNKKLLHKFVLGALAHMKEEAKG